MSRRKKFLTIILAVLLLSQIPFAYRRYRLGRLNAAIQSLTSERVSPDKSGAITFKDYKGVIHVHSFLGGHSTGTFQEIIAGAKANNLDFVIMTEHVESSFDTSALTLSGTHEGVLFVNGNEVETATGDRMLSIPGDAYLSLHPKLTTDEVGTNIHSRNALAIIAYPENFTGSSERADGMEVYNVFTNAKRINRLLAFFDALWSHHSYPDLLFANYLQRPNESLAKWDQMLARKRLVATAGNDSHSNIGVTLNDNSGHELLGFKLDPYETSFHLVRVHVLVPTTEFPDTISTPLDTAGLINALRDGHCYIGFDLLSDTTGFRFEAVNGKDGRIQGDEIPLRNDTKLQILSPLRCRLLIFKDGQIISEQNDVSTTEFKVDQRGVYRVEAYLPQLGDLAGKQPWIISNPIYVR